MISASDKYFLMLITPIRFVGNLAKKKNTLMPLFLQPRRSWMQEIKGWGIRSKLFLYAITARWAEVGVALSTDAQPGWLWPFPGCCITSVPLGEVSLLQPNYVTVTRSLTSPSEPQPWVSRHVSLLITPSISSIGRGFVAIMGSHVRELKSSK